MQDSHAHLTQEPLKSTALEHLKAFKGIQGKYILNCAFDVDSITEVIKQSMDFENQFPNMIQTAIGIHPETVSDFTITHLNSEVDRALEILSENLKTYKKRINAIGECGLDYYHLSTRKEFSKEELEQRIECQKYLFRNHIEIAIKNNLPLTIHTRDVTDNTHCFLDALKIIATSGKGLARGCFHSFTGPENVLKEILDLGLYIGFNGIITYPNGHNVRRLLEMTPIEKILIETDAPYLPPQKVRSGKSGSIKYGKPADVVEIIEKVSEVKGISFEKIVQITNNNYEQLFLTN